MEIFVKGFKEHIKKIIFSVMIFSSSAYATTFNFSTDNYYELEQRFALRKEEVSQAKEKYLFLQKRINEVFEPIFKKESLKIEIKSDFNEDFVAQSIWKVDAGLLTAYNIRIAYAGFDSLDSGDVYFKGSMLGVKSMTLDAFTLIVCHEIGHILGGKPYSNRKKMFIKRTSSEGQSDYYSTSECTRLLWKDEMKEAQTPVAHVGISKKIWNQCEQQFQDINEQKICKRSLNAIYELSQFSWVTQSGPVTLDFISNEQVKSTILTHTPFQCRMETLMAGALYNPKVNSKKVGLRPGCWFKN